MSTLLRNRWVQIGLIAVVAIVLIVAPLMLPVFANQTLIRIGVYAVAVLGLNIVMGYAGQVNLGQIFFLGLGAYVAAYGVTHDWNILLVFVAACVIPGVVGLLIALAASRLGGLAIAMITIALPIVGVPLAKRLSDLTGGSQGVSARFSGAPEWSGLFDDQWQYYIVLVVTVGAFVLGRNLVRGKFGRGFKIVRENEAVAASMGVSPYRYKVLAFTIASILGGASGFLYLAAVQYTSPETLSFGHSIALLAAMVIGGAGSIAGSLIGGIYYVFVPQVTNAIDPTLTAISQGVILLAVLFLLPGGLVSLPRVIRRLTRRRTSRPTQGGSPQTTPAQPPPAAVAQEGPENTERQSRS
ncbi:MAG TPA: branched-chain amino acid ABC transporter permease [Agromyces sp.]|nr:branched-chain amino acid ABC transporter permease [Agromyces sp.]